MDRTAAAWIGRAAAGDGGGVFGGFDGCILRGAHAVFHGDAI